MVLLGEFKVPDSTEVRRRINDCPMLDIRMALKAAYVLAARVSEIVAHASPTDKTKGRGPRGSDAVLDTFILGPISEPAVVFNLKTAKRQGWPRSIGLPLNYEPWAKELYDYFQRFSDRPVFPFTRQLLGLKTREMMIFTGLDYSILKYPLWKDGKVLRRVPQHDKPFALHALRHVRASELAGYYGFEGTDLATYLGWTYRTVGLPAIMERYVSINWQRYFPKLLKRRV